VDDDPAVRRSLVRLLETMGFASADFASAEDLLASGLAHTLCCLLLDVELRDMSGPELYVHLMESRAGLPVIFISAAPDAETMVRARTGGPVQVLAKPVDADYLRAVIARALLSGPG
jgi:FixJ family two-component response regulator